MVATDVASRGIGMIKNPLPQTATLRCLHSDIALLSTLRRFLDCVILPGFFRVFRFSIIGCLGSAFRHVVCCTRKFQTKSTFPGTRCGIGIS